jgi:ankyrin repeat protein
MNRIDRELIVAAREYNVLEARRLLSVEAEVNAKDRYGFTPLSWASENGHVQIFKELVEHGADSEAKDNVEWTPLHYACRHDHLALVNELLIRGANLEAKTNLGDTPLHWACFNDHLPVVKALLSGGANILAANNGGRLPIDHAVRQGHSEVSKYLLQEFYATSRRLPLHELLEDLTWIGDPNRVVSPPLRYALHQNVLGLDDVVDILEYLVGQNLALLSSRDQDAS